MLIFDDVSVTAGKAEILKNVSFDIRPHTLTVIIGKNASGKSTLLKALCSQIKYTGRITFCEKDIALMSARERAQLISFLPQTLPRVSLTGEELVSMGRTPYLDIGKRLSQDDIKKVQTAIDEAGINDIKNKNINLLSGGEKQKAFLAMTFAQGTRITVFDEPTTYLDAEHEKEICCYLKRLKTEKKKTVIAVMHDINYALEIADKIIFLDEGRVIFSGSARECADSGLIEKVYKMKKYLYIAEDGKRILFR